MEPVETGNAGVVGQVQRRADVAIADHECPILPTADWSPNRFSGLSFTVPEAVIPEWQETLGIDVVYLAANHMSDRGVADPLDPPAARQARAPTDGPGHEPRRGPRAGVGRRRGDQGRVRGLQRCRRRGPCRCRHRRRALDHPGQHPGGRQPRSRRRRRRDHVRPPVVGRQEYHDDLLPKQVKQLGWFEELGCDHVVGAGTHVAGPMLSSPSPRATS